MTMKNNPALEFAKKNMMVIALVIVVIFFSISTGGKILYAQNINNLISQNGYVFILATGMLLCILTGGNIDLSVGSVVCFVGAVGAVMMERNIPTPAAVLAMLAVGLLVGMFQGFWIAWVSVPPFIATLAGMYAFRGFSNVVLQGFTISVENKAFLDIFGGGATCYIPDFLHGGDFNITCMLAGIILVGLYICITVGGWLKSRKKGLTDKVQTSEILRLAAVSALFLWIFYKLANYKGIPTVLIWIGLILVLYGYITKYTAIGRYFYAVGGNEKATRLSGVNTKLVYFIAYANMGLLAGLAGILTIARQANAQPTFGQGYEMDAIAACFIGGASAYGGVGKVTGMIIGAVLMGVINQGMSIMGISTNYQRAVKGVVLLVAVLVDILSKKEKA